jgi:hypothetical protein
MPQAEFESTIPVFVRAKTVRALELAATVIGLHIQVQWTNISKLPSLCTVHFGMRYEASQYLSLRKCRYKPL